MIKDIFKIIVFFTSAFIISITILLIKVCKTVLSLVFTPVIKNSMDCPLHILFIKQIGVFILYSLSAIAFYYIQLPFNTGDTLINILVSMWCVMLVIEGIIPMAKEYIKKK